MKTTPAKPVLDGNRVKWTLEQEHQASQHKVRIDWLRFTVPLDAVVQADHALPPNLSVLELMDQQGRDVVRMCRGTDPALGYTTAQAVARSGAQTIARMLPAFEVGVVDDKGMDYYSARCALMYEGAVVGWVLSGGKTDAQAGTVHVNLFGTATLHVSHANWAGIREFVDRAKGWITRVDLALDLFTGFDITSVQRSYLAGEFDVRGKRPGQREIGSWTLGHSRTFEVGSRGTGKVFRGYEKGDQLLGHEANDPWVRLEVEMRSNHRIVDLDVLTRPADFFAGTYSFCARMLAEQAVEAAPESMRTVSELADKTVDAAAVRVIRWLRRTAGPALARVFWDGGEAIAAIVDSEGHRVPRRFVGFSRTAIADALQKVAAGLTPSAAPFANGVA